MIVYNAVGKSWWKTSPAILYPQNGLIFKASKLYRNGTVPKKQRKGRVRAMAVYKRHPGSSFTASHCRMSWSAAPQ